MRNRFLFVIALSLAVAACEDDILPTNPPVAAKTKVTAPASASVSLTRVDTTRSSSICKATVRARTRARITLDESPTDFAARRKATAFDVLVADACK